MENWTDFLVPHHIDGLARGGAVPGVRRVRHSPKHSISGGTKDSVIEANDTECGICKKKKIKIKVKSP